VSRASSHEQSFNFCFTFFFLFATSRTTTSSYSILTSILVLSNQKTEQQRHKQFRFALLCAQKEALTKCHKEIVVFQTGKLVHRQKLSGTGVSKLDISFLTMTESTESLMNGNSDLWKKAMEAAGKHLNPVSTCDSEKVGNNPYLNVHVYLR
jgi:hypothetical protein